MNFKKIFYESLPVEERDDYMDFLKKEKDIANTPTKERIINNKLKKDIKIFFGEFLGLPEQKLSLYSTKDGKILFKDIALFEYDEGYTPVKNSSILESQVNSVLLRKLEDNPEAADKVKFNLLEDQLSKFAFTLNFKGVNRVQAGPLVGKLQKAGFRVDYIREKKSLEIFFEGFDDVEKFNKIFTLVPGWAAVLGLFIELSD